MTLLLRFFASVVIVSRRLIAQWGLAVVTLIGLVVSISMMLSIPLYADAVYHRTFLEKVGQVGIGNARQPFSFVFAYAGTWYGNRQWDDIQPLDAYLKSDVQNALGMRLQSLERYVETSAGELYPASGNSSGFDNPDLQLAGASFGQMSHLEDHIRLVEGRFPQPQPAGETISTVEVLVSLPLANTLGLQPGEVYTVLLRGDTETGAQVSTAYPVRVTGIWEPLAPDGEYWIFSPSMLTNVLLVPEQTFAIQISPFLPDEIKSAFWFFVMDGSKIRSNHVNGLLGRIQRLQYQAGALLPDLDTLFSPVEALRSYQRAARLLAILLYAFSVPVIGLVLAFISLVANLSLERKFNEIAVTRSRGATTGQVLGSVALESLVLGCVALLVSLPVALLAARWISAPPGIQELSQSYLQAGVRGVWNILRQTVAVQPGLQIADLWNPATLRIGVIAVLINLVAMVLPAISASRHTIVSYKRERARNLRPPWWQRAWLDVILLLVAAYGAYMLKQQGGVVAVMVSPYGEAGLTNPMSNPLLFLVPSLIVFAASMFLLRLIPPLMSLAAWLFSHLRSVGLLLAARHLSRSAATYRTPFIILVFTLSLSAYTASLARTLDNHLYVQTYYQVGADMKFLELGDTPPENPFGMGPQSEESPTNQFVFVPVTEYLRVPGVQAISRIGKFPAAFQSADGQPYAGMFYGIDRIDFPKVAYWRRDFAREDLGTLMNRLGATQNGVLVPYLFLDQFRLRVGDTVRLNVDMFQQESVLEFVIVGAFEMFPTWYPENGSLFVGNLDYLFENVGGEFPYHVWMKLDPAADPAGIASEGLESMGLQVLSWEASLPKVQSVQDDPERQGVLGLLTLGFAASAVLTALGFLLYALFSYQRRFIELGVMRAGGLSVPQMAIYLGMELSVLIGFGGVLGT